MALIVLGIMLLCGASIKSIGIVAIIFGALKFAYNLYNLQK